MPCRIPICIVGVLCVIASNDRCMYASIVGIHVPKDITLCFHYEAAYNVVMKSVVDSTGRS